MVRTTRPDGSDPQWLGAIAHVSGLAYSFTTPGGADQMSCVLQIPPSARTSAMDPGRTVEIYRGGSVVWTGKLNEPQPSVSGWSLAAHGLGTLGTDYCAVYVPLSDWTLNAPVDQAISRGLPWVNPGISAGWLAQQVDSGSQTVTDHLNMLATPSGQTWSVDRYGTLTVFPLPTVVNRLIVATDPVARTIANDITTVFMKYEQSDDGQGNTTYGLTDAFDQEDIDLHGPQEIYQDLSNAGVMSAGAVQAVGNEVLARYQRAAWAGPFTVRFGQLLTTGGTPIDLGTEQSGNVARLLVTDAPFGGESYAGVITFLIGAYSYSDDDQTAQITPYTSARTDFASLLSLIDVNA
jgi:hypothetical protein